MRSLGRRRLSLSLSVAASAAIAASALVSPAQAAPADTGRTPSPTASSRRALDCAAQVVGVDSHQRLVMEIFDGNRMRSAEHSAPLPFDPTGLGYYSSSSTKTAYIEKLEAVTADGTPRLLTAKTPVTGGRISVTSKALDQSGFAPRLFTDGSSYRAYTVSDTGVLKRWFLTRYADGSRKFSHARTLGSDFDSLTAITSYATFKINGSWRDVLFATTESGALEELVVPVNHPDQLRQKVLRSTGYVGVQGLSAGVCNHTWAKAFVIAVKPDSDSATWTTISPADDPSHVKATPHGLVEGPADWNLHAVF